MDSKRTADVTNEPNQTGTPAPGPSATAYPFLTRRQLAARVDADAAFMEECALVLEARTQQRAEGAAPSGKPWGWMSSECVVAGKLVAKLHDGSMTEADQGRLKGLVRRYSRQLADHCRALALDANPGLAEIAAKFGVLPLGSDSGVQRPPTPEEPPEQLREERLSQPEEAERDPDDELPRRVVAHVEVAPGQRTEEIARALDVTTAMLAPTLRVLVQGKGLKKRGLGRGTRYFPR